MSGDRPWYAKLTTKISNSFFAILDFPGDKLRGETLPDKANKLLLVKLVCFKLFVLYFRLAFKFKSPDKL